MRDISQIIVNNPILVEVVDVDKYGKIYVGSKYSNKKVRVVLEDLNNTNVGDENE